MAFRCRCSGNGFRQTAHSLSSASLAATSGRWRYWCLDRQGLSQIVQSPASRPYSLRSPRTDARRPGLRLVRRSVSGWPRSWRQRRPHGCGLSTQIGRTAANSIARCLGDQRWGHRRIRRGFPWDLGYVGPATMDAEARALSGQCAAGPARHRPGEDVDSPHPGTSESYYRRWTGPEWRVFGGGADFRPSGEDVSGGDNPPLTMSTLFASECVEQPGDCFGSRMFSRVPSVFRAGNAVRVPPRAQHITSSEGLLL